MKPRTSLLLVLLAVIVLAGGWYFGVHRGAPVASTVAAGQLAFPGVAPRLQQAARIDIQHEGKTLVLSRHGDAWGVDAAAGYPAQATKVHDLLAGLADLRLTEPRTADPAQFGRLGLEDAGKPHADSTLISVLDGEAKPIIALLVGHTRMRGQYEVPDQIFVRRPGENQSWLAEGRLPLDSTDALMWLDRDIVNIDHTKIATVAATRGSEHLDFVRDGDKLVPKLPPDHPKLDEAKLGDVAKALEFLTFIEVKPAAKMPGEPMGRSTFTTSDGLKLDVTVNKSGNEIWARFAAAGDGAAKPVADQLDRKLAGWAYELGGWKERALVPVIDDLKEPPPPAAGAPPPTISMPGAPGAPPLAFPPPGAPPK
jgi:hypothetical protein